MSSRADGEARSVTRVGRSRGVAKRALRLRRYGSTSPCCARPSHRARAQLMPALLEPIMKAKHADLTPNGRREFITPPTRRPGYVEGENISEASMTKKHEAGVEEKSYK